MSSTDVNTSSIPHIGPRPRRTIADRLTSLFNSKGGNIGDYYIELDEPLKHYGPGDTVKGKVVVNVARPLGITHVVVCLFGYVEVFKNHKPRFNPRTNNPRAASGRGKRWVTEYYGDGFATLFEDESIICGEGRLNPKLYHFNFEIDFPTNMTLPSSIEFERGTISYIVSSTITRPTTIAPTTSCERKVKYQDSIDVGSFSTPKPRVITLEPVENGGRKKAGIKRLASHSHDSATTSRTSTHSTTAATSSRNTRLSFSPDDIRSHDVTSPSFQGGASAGGNTASESQHRSEIRSSRTSHSPRTDAASQSSQTIEVNVTMERAACLPGGFVPLKVTVHHFKDTKSLYGVIVTLYRQARTDMHPNLPLKSSSDNDTSKKYEDYYPRSKTGLGGLSLSAAGSSQVWRKDLSQTFAPLYVDPHTLSTEVKAVVRVPDDAFPSISNAPGGMISFNYFVEVLVDVHGKLAQGTTFPSLNLTGGLPSIPSGPLTSDANYGRDQYVTAWGLNCVDTSQILRERSALSCVNDLVIGTKDTAKARGKRRQESAPLENGTVHTNGDHHGPWHDGGRADQGSHDGYDDSHEDYDYSSYGCDFHSNQRHYWNYPNGYGDGSWNDPNFVAAPGHDHQSARNFNDTPTNWNATGPHALLSPPQMPDEANMTEKERLRQAEQQLLPSRPPDSYGEGPREEEALRHGHIPTAPVLPNESDFDSTASYQAAVARQHAVPASQRHGVSPSPFSAEADPRLPAYEPRGGEVSTPGAVNTDRVAEPVEATASSDDKQELERRRLQAMASSPETDAPVEEYHSSRPTAPSLDSPQVVHGYALGAPALDEPGSSAVSVCNQPNDASCGDNLSRSFPTTKAVDGDIAGAGDTAEAEAANEVVADDLTNIKADSIQDPQQANDEFTEVKESSDEEEQEKGKSKGL
ncbi:MAG: ph-response sensor protein [Alyxoria varia]|nr:MAG: ph-response sensor protein [Alyxoria varia]